MAATEPTAGEAAVTRAPTGLSVHRTRLPRDGGRTCGAPLSPELDALADRVRRLLPSRRDPEAFHIERDAIERALRRLARQRGPLA